MTGKIVECKAALDLIQDGDMIAIGGFVGMGHPEGLTRAIEERFLQQGFPRDLSLIYGAGQGDRGRRGLNHFAHDGLVRRIIGGHWGLAPLLCTMAIEGRIEAYNWPQGVIIHLYRDIAAGKPGTVTRVGLHTFVDPRLDGGRVNKEATPKELVEVIRLAGEEYLFYPRQQIDVGLIRGTTADPDGNISMEREAIFGEMLAIAQAVHNCGGKVIAQVERKLESRLPMRLVRVPGVLVDAVVVAEPDDHWQTFGEQFNPAFLADSSDEAPELLPCPLDERKIIARRAAMELRSGDIVNLGIGLPETVALVAAEEGIFDKFTLTIETGVFGGVPAGKLDFGASYAPTAIIDSPAMFDFYEGGGLDCTCLGAAQIDARGNVNVSRFGNQMPGAGGFINISQNTRRVVYCGTFTVGGLKVGIESGALKILQEGHTTKFVDKVEQITFNGPFVHSSGHSVLYVTERAVFELGEDGPVLTELAPGIDLEADVLAQMAFRPRVSSNLKTMDPRIFTDAPMGLRKDFATEESTRKRTGHRRAHTGN